MTVEPFWRTIALAEMSEAQWESLCDGCGRCCLIKLEDEDTEALHFTRVACRLLDTRRCRCSDYANRERRVAGCVRLSPDNIAALDWLPRTCAYRLIHEGKALHDWHPLVSGDANSVHRAGISVRGRVLSERHVHEDEYETHIIHWVS